MSGKAFAARPPGADSWVRAQDAAAARVSPFTARLTIDVTPAARARIKIAAFARGQTVADMVRGLLDREYPETEA